MHCVTLIAPRFATTKAESSPSSVLTKETDMTGFTRCGTVSCLAMVVVHGTTQYTQPIASSCLHYQGNYRVVVCVGKISVVYTITGCQVLATEKLRQTAGVEVPAAQG